MTSNVLPDSVIVGMVLAGLQLLKSLVPQTAAWPNNVIRAIGFVGCYAMVIVNTLVTGPLTWQGVWGLLPLAGALAGSATLLYHLATDSAPTTRSATAPSAPAPGTPISIYAPARTVAPPPTEGTTVTVVPTVQVTAPSSAPHPPPAALSGSFTTPPPSAGTDSAPPAPP